MDSKRSIKNVVRSKFDLICLYFVGRCAKLQDTMSLLLKMEITMPNWRIWLFLPLHYVGLAFLSKTCAMALLISLMLLSENNLNPDKRNLQSLIIFFKYDGLRF